MSGETDRGLCAACRTYIAEDGSCQCVEDWPSPMTRQVGSPVAWRWRFEGAEGWAYADDLPIWAASDDCDEAVQPLIPASDLEQITREREEAVGLLQKFAAMPLRCSPEGMVRAARAFLASLASTPKP